MGNVKAVNFGNRITAGQALIEVQNDDDFDSTEIIMIGRYTKDGDLIWQWTECDLPSLAYAAVFLLKEALEDNEDVDVE